MSMYVRKTKLQNRILFTRQNVSWVEEIAKSNKSKN